MTLADDAHAARVNFGSIATGSIVGQAFIDQDGNGAVDVGELGQPDVTMQLIGAGADGVLGTDDDQELAEFASLPDGYFEFTGLDAGDYEVRAIRPLGLTPTTTDSFNVSLTDGGVAGASIGYRLIDGLSGKVFDDRNDNGRRDGTEEGIDLSPSHSSEQVRTGCSETMTIRPPAQPVSATARSASQR